MGKPADGAAALPLPLPLPAAVDSALGTVTVVNRVVVLWLVEVEPYGPPAPVPAAAVVVAVGAAACSETGHTVVPMAMTWVVTWPMWAGQLVTVGAQDVTVYVEVA